VSETTLTVELTDRQRLERIDMLLCILFSGLAAHPLATSLIPPAELAQLRAILPQE
jgi:hypothetical protein